MPEENILKQRRTNTTILLVQVGLLFVGYLFDFFFYNEGKTELLMLSFLFDTFFLQFFFVQYVSIILGLITYTKNSWKFMVIIDAVAILISFFVMLGSFMFCVLFGAEGYHGNSRFTHYSTYYLELFSLIILVVKTVFDGKWRSQNRKHS